MEAYLQIDWEARGSLQSKLRGRISAAIASGILPEGHPLPATRTLAAFLGISRNTVTLAYQELAAEGYLTVRKRRGFYVAPQAVIPVHARKHAERRDGVDWSKRLIQRPSELKTFKLPIDWHKKKYTFVYGQHDRFLFPISSWRKCSRDSLSRHDVHDWTVDYVDADDPMLLEEFRNRIAPRRGFSADLDEILVTIGAQQALFLTAQLLIGPGKTVGIEDPCYGDARNIFRFCGANILPIPVDDDGMIVDERLALCDIVYTTPSHQSPTTVTMSKHRRNALLSAARKHDIIVIEDDYDTESHFDKLSSSAIKPFDEDGRVVYLTSLSKLLSPGLRMGFFVASPRLVEEVRALRRFNIRHPPANNQRTIALFLRGGHYESLLTKFHNEYNLKWQALRAAVAEHLPGCRITPSEGGSSLWLRGPKGLDATELARLAYERDVVIEPGECYFQGPDRPKRFFRLGFTSIQLENIAPGVAILGDVLRAMSAGSSR